jgi:glycosyltransferase involved in cell wall biosynthesis
LFVCLFVCLLQHRQAKNSSPPKCIIKSFEFLGEVDFNSMPALYSAGDIFVIPRPEGGTGESFIPLKLLEAMAMEKLVLVSNMRAMLEIMEDKKNGLVFQKGDKADFLRKLNFSINNADKLSGLKQAARRRVINSYNWARSREILARLYREIIPQ